MRILVTGAKGFVGRNLVENLKNIQAGKNRTRNIMIDDVYEFDIDTDKALLDTYCKDADFVFNLAGVNRPQSQSEFMEGNFGFASTLLETSYALNCEPMNGRVLFGTKGSINLDTMKIMSEMNGFMTDVSLVDLKSYYDTTGMFQAEINHFVDCCLNGTPCIAPAEDGVVIMKILDALYESARTGKSVDIE